jgi:Spy/CpxP family protein refolding chaperone
MNISRLFFGGLLACSLVVPIAGLAQVTPAPNATSANATPPPGSPGQRHGRHGMFMEAMKGITLSDPQKTQIQQLIEAFRQQHPRGSPRDPQAMKQFHDALLNVLTAQQQTQFKANVQAIRDRMGQRRMPGTGGSFAPTPSPVPSSLP